MNETTTTPRNRSNRNRIGRTSTTLSVLAAAVALLGADSCELRPTYTVASQSYQLDMHGGPGGDDFEFDCPANTVLTAMKGRHGGIKGVMDALHFECSQLNPTGYPGGVVDTSPTFGGSGGVDFDSTCPPGTMISGVHGSAKTVVDGLGVYCSTFGQIRIDDDEPVELPRWGGVANGFDHFFTHDRCPIGFVATGAAGRADRYIDAFALRCSKIENSNTEPGCVLDDRDPADLYDDVTYYLPPRGTIHSAFAGKAEFNCPAGAVLTKIEGRSDVAVNQIKFECRTLNACEGGLGATVETVDFFGRGPGPFGGNGGTAFSEECPSDMFITGLFGHAASSINEIGIRCGNLGDAISGRSHVTLGGHGTREGNSFNDRCPPGFIATGGWGHFDDYVNYIKLRCTKFDEVHVAQ